jgi:hypothetical protein
MMHSSDEDIELCSVDRTEPNFLQKKHKNNQKIRKISGTEELQSKCAVTK